MSAASWSAAPRTARARRARGGWRLPVAAARLPAFLALAAYGAHAWSRMVDPDAWGALVTVLLAALAGAAVLVLVARRRLETPARVAATLLVAVVLLVVALAAAGVPGDLAGPRSWDDVATGLAEGLSVVPNVRVPYHGVEQWTRIAIVLGGGALVVLAALLAFAPRRDGVLGAPIAAALALGALYLVPVMQRDGAHQYLGGATFAVLLALFLWLERVERRALPLASGVVAVAVVAALVVAPRVDGSRALLDYEGIAQSLSSVNTHYSWDHGYGPLSWPRDGREILRVRSTDRAYWKAANLTTFDGRRWVQGGAAQAPDLDAGLDARHPRWRQTLFVTVRELRTSQFIGAGTTLAIADAPRQPVPYGPGSYVTRGKPLRRGNAYRAVVYTPRPSVRDLRRAALLALPARADLTSILVPARRPPAPPVLVQIPPWGRGEPSQRSVDTLRASPYARAYDLAQRLRARSADPYAYMRAVEGLLAHGFDYSERPRRSAYPLMDFLFGARSGYCQQFSGAMALLLRLGGVPARVGAGFSPGVFDHTRREFVIRDYDAHSWVEVFFPGIGWVTRDPTPADSPARSQLDERRRAAGLSAGVTPDGAGSDPAPAPDAASPGASAAGTEHGRSPLPEIALSAAGALAALGALLAVRRRRRRPRLASDELAEESLAELRRALRRSGRPPSAQTTLDTLAERWRATPAEAYLRALTATRYGYGEDGPTAAQRAALRRELASGRGLVRWPRAWWALPPRMPRLARIARPRAGARDRAATS